MRVEGEMNSPPRLGMEKISTPSALLNITDAVAKTTVIFRDEKICTRRIAPKHKSSQLIIGATRNVPKMKSVPVIRFRPPKSE
jgi:hypothetical protein